MTKAEARKKVQAIAKRNLGKKIALSKIKIHQIRDDYGLTDIDFWFSESNDSHLYNYKGRTDKVTIIA